MRRHAPKDAKLYGKIQSSDYLVPDTKQEEAYQRSFTPTMRNRRRLYIWFMYGVLGIVVCLVILFVLYCCKKIEKTRSADERPDFFKEKVRARELPEP